MDEAINKNRVFGVDDPKELGADLATSSQPSSSWLLSSCLDQQGQLQLTVPSTVSVVSTNLLGNMVIIEDMNCKIDIIEGKENIK